MSKVRLCGLAPQRVQVTVGSEKSGWMVQVPGGGGHSGRGAPLREVPGGGVVEVGVQVEMQVRLEVQVEL